MKNNTFGAFWIHLVNYTSKQLYGKLMIPKIIHQFWIGTKKAPVEFMETWKKHHPDWKYMLWDEKLLQQHFPKGLENQEQYDAIPTFSGKCDIARYEILYKFGGFFPDADSVCLRPLTPELLQNDSFSCYENEWIRGQLVAAGFLGCIPKNLLMSLLITGISKKTKEELQINDAWFSVGPRFLTDAIFLTEYRNITIYPSWYFLPYHFLGAKYTGLGKPFAVHFWGSTPNDTIYNYDDDTTKVWKLVEEYT